jgi:hypothetical protein
MTATFDVDTLDPIKQPQQAYLEVVISHGR